MSKILLLIVFSLLGAGVAKAQDSNPIASKQHFSCRFWNRQNNETILIKDVDVVDSDAAARLARVSELTDIPDLTKWVLFSDVGNPHPSETFEKGVFVACKPSSVSSPMVVGKQSSGQPYVIAQKFKYACTYKSGYGSRLIYNNEVAAISPVHAVRVARMSELKWEDQAPGRPKRWVLLSDLNNPTPSYSYNGGVNVECIPAPLR